MPESSVTSIAVACMISLAMLSPPVQASEDEVLEALESFIAAFEAGDIESMEASFSRNAVTFPRSIMAHEYDRDIEPADLEIQMFGDAALVTFHLVGGARPSLQDE